MIAINLPRLLPFRAVNFSIGYWLSCKLNRLRPLSACHYLLFIVVIFYSPLAVADKIYLKDGSVEESHLIWESDNYVHFILKGTKDVEIRYAKTIVVRIERTDPPPPVKIMESRKPTVFPEKDHKAVKAALTNENIVPSKVQPENSKVSAQKAKINIDHKIVQRNTDVAFFNPKRDKKYWSDRNSGHTKLSNAIASIARYYGKTPAWVEQHMGQENDLGLIHSNLIAAIENDEQPSAAETEAIHFLKKGSSEINADNRSMPEENHAEVKAASVSRDTPDPPSISKDILFYDPRRPKKYWASMSSHHNTLDGAVHALAEFYGIPASWVEDHLGNTNQLYKIHENIQGSLKALNVHD